MDLKYKFTSNISNNRTVFCKELTNKNVIDIQKYITSNEDNLLFEYFDQLVIDNIESDHELNFIDKFLILISIRINSIGSYLELQSKNNIKNAVDLKVINDKILSKFNFKKDTFTFKNITIVFNLPTTLSFSNTVYDYIYSIEYGGLKICLGNLNVNEKEEFLNNLPDKLIYTINKKINRNIGEPVELFKFKASEDSDETIYFDYSFNAIFYFLKLLYSNNLENLHYEQYICAKNLHIQPSEYYNLTPSETKLLLGNLKKEYEKINKVSSDKPPSIPSHGLSNANI